MKNSSLKFILKNQGFDSFVSLLEDLSKIDDLIKIKISYDKTFLYSMKGKDNIILAFKNYYIDTDKFFDRLDLEKDIDIIIPNSSRFVKNLKFIDKNEPIEATLTVKSSDDTLETRSIELKNKKLKLKWLTAEKYEVKDIRYEALVKLLDTNNQKLSFDIDRNDFEDIKKLSNINSSGLIEINCDSGNVFISEHSAWEIKVDEITDNSCINYNINKNLLKFINDGGESIRFHVFPNFLLIKDDISNVMVSFEQSY